MKSLVLGVLMVGSGAMAQDTRRVTEPVVPPVCVRLAASLQALPGAVADTLGGGDEEKLDTARIQAAMDGCKAGQAVELAGSAGKMAFLSGPLELRAGVTLLIDKGVTLFGSRDPAVYENRVGAAADAPLKCGTSVARPGQFGVAPGPQVLSQISAMRRGGCRPLLSATNVKGAAIMGEGTIDGRGYATLKGKDYSWWEMARRAEPKDDIYFSTRLLVANHADGLVLYGITLHNSPNFHVTVNATNGFTAWGVHLLTPTDRTLDARNTDGIDPGGSTNVTVAHSWIDNGDDNIAIKSGTTHMSVLDNHFYSGHGMSIGSETEGQAYLLVDSLTEDHTTSGIRIKSNVTRGGSVHDLTYRNVCMRGVPNPIAISPYYTNQTTEKFVDPGYTGTKIPDYKRIVLDNVHSESAGDVLIAGLNEEHRTQIALRDVTVKGITAAQLHLAYADVVTVPPGTNFSFSGKSVRLVELTKDTPEPEDSPFKGVSPGKNRCATAFVPMR